MLFAIKLIELKQFPKSKSKRENTNITRNSQCTIISAKWKHFSIKNNKVPNKYKLTIKHLVTSGAFHRLSYIKLNSKKPKIRPEKQKKTKIKSLIFIKLSNSIKPKLCKLKEPDSNK